MTTRQTTPPRENPSAQAKPKDETTSIWEGMTKLARRLIALEKKVAALEGKDASKSQNAQGSST